MDRWGNPAELHRDHDTALYLIRQQGVIFADDPIAKGQAREILAKIFLAMPDVIFSSILSLVYVYDQGVQPPAISGNDGYASISERLPDGRKVASIGISTQAIKCGPEYAALIVMHELAHITVNGRLVSGQHGGAFHIWLDMLIRRYNSYHHTSIKNDYVVIPFNQPSRRGL